MKDSLYILSHVIDDFGNAIQVCHLTKDAYQNRYNYFKGN